MQLLKRYLTNKNILIPLILILILGSLLRFYALGNQSLWNDELSSWARSSYDNLSAVMEKGIYPDVHPPGYPLLLYFIEKYIGDSESVLRFPSAVSGVLSVFVIFLLGTRLYSYKEGLIASVFTAVLWCPIYYSQEARSYSMLLLFSLLATYFWIVVLGNLRQKVKPSYHALLGYIVSAIICSYLHYFGTYLIALQGLGTVSFFIRRRKAWVYIILIYFLILLAFSPWLPTMYQHLNKGPIWIKAPRGFTTSFTRYLHFLFNESKQLYMFVLVLYLFLFLRSLYDILISKKYKKISGLFLSPGLLLILWLIIPFVGVYIKSAVSAPVLTSRNLIISLPAAYLLLSRSITTLPLRSKYIAIITLVVVGIFLSDLVFRMDYYSKPHKQQFREAVGFIVEYDHLYKDSLIIGYSGHGGEYLNYYFRRKNSNRRVNVYAGRRKDIPKLTKAIAKENPQYVWYIHAHKNPERQFMNFMGQNFKYIGHKRFVGANVLLFKNK